MVVYRTNRKLPRHPRRLLFHDAPKNRRLLRRHREAESNRRLSSGTRALLFAEQSGSATRNMSQDKQKKRSLALRCGRWLSGRCPKCQRGNPEKLGEMLSHTRISAGWDSVTLSKLWRCRGCSHMWNTQRPDNNSDEGRAKRVPSGAGLGSENLTT